MHAGDLPCATLKHCTRQGLPHRIAHGPEVAQRAVRLPGDLLPAQWLGETGMQHNVRQLLRAHCLHDTIQACACCIAAPRSHVLPLQMRSMHTPSYH